MISNRNCGDCEGQKPLTPLGWRFSVRAGKPLTPLAGAVGGYGANDRTHINI